MAEARSIEALSFHFTAGVAAGTLLSGAFRSPWILSGGVFLVIALWTASLLRKEGRERLVLPLFLLCGLSCALSASVSGPFLPGGTLGKIASEAATRLRQHIDGIPFASEETAPLLKALLTGDRSALSRETVHVFRDSGASHLLALSGLHMGILYLFLSRLTWIAGSSPRIRALRYGLMVTAAAFFTLMAGASPSLVRAFLFILINETLRILGRPKDPVRVLSAALLIQLAADPSVIRSTGFQLSYLAMAGIFLLYPHLERWYPEGGRFNPLRKVWQTAALSVSCQVFTSPLAWIRFHSFPVHFLLTNLLAIPLTTLLMGSAVLMLVTGSPAFLASLTDRLARLLSECLRIIASM